MDSNIGRKDLDLQDNDNVELKKRLLGATTEIGTGIGTDLLTGSLLNPATVAGTKGLSILAYAGINGFQGAYTNYLVQKHLYGADNVNWGEILSSGALSAIPFMNLKAGKNVANIVGDANTVRRGIVGGAGLGLAGEQLRVGIDEQRLLSPLEASMAVGLGGGIGGGLTQLSKLGKKPNVVPKFDPTGATDDLMRQQAGLKMRLLNSIDPDRQPTQSFVPPTSKEIYDMKQELMMNRLADASGKLNIWNYFKNKKGRSDWGRLMAKKVQTLPHTKESWGRIKKELQNDFLSIYPEPFLKTIKVKNAKGNWVSLSKKNIEVEHIFTLQQSMPLFAGLEWGGKEWQDVARQILSKQFATGDTRQNLIAVPEHIHRIKTQYFNKVAGISGRTFFTDEVIRNMIKDDEYRKKMLNLWLKEVEKGKKIIDDGLAIWETLYKGKDIPLMPEELVERLASIDLDNANIEKVIPQIFEDFKEEGFTVDAWNVKELKAEQLKIDRKDVSAAEAVIDKEIKSNPKKYNNPYPFGMRDNDLRERAEAAWNEIRKNRLLRENIQDDLFESPKQKERFIKYTMKSILNQQKRNNK